MYKILIVDDNKQITSILSDFAIKEGHQTYCVYDGGEVMQAFNSFKPDLVLLDVMLPNIDGFQICKQIRNISNIPIIMITARSEDFEKIMGLEIGADDYIIKPFSANEVMARIKAIMRRINQFQDNNILRISNLSINALSYQVKINDHIINLTKKEFEILYTLAGNKDKVFSRDNLLNTIWGYDYFGDNRTVDSHIKRLRIKLDQYDHPLWDIKTIWGIGYKFEENNDV